MIARRAVVLGAMLIAAAPVRARGLPRVRLSTALGDVVIELEAKRAPVTVANFLRYVDAGMFDKGAFYRVVRPDNDHNPATISVVQGGLDREDGLFPPIAHETTAMTGLHNTDGVLSMARDGPGTATAEFSISVGGNPALDFGGARNADGQGFAAFGRVVKGMDVIRRINRLPAAGVSDSDYTAGQMLTDRVPFTIRRV